MTPSVAAPGDNNPSDATEKHAISPMIRSNKQTQSSKMADDVSTCVPCAQVMTCTRHVTSLTPCSFDDSPCRSDVTAALPSRLDIDSSVAAKRAVRVD